jgi:hypothetical protein
MHPGESPHGAYLKIFVNNIAMKAIKDMTMPLPIGSIVVKENYAKDKETLAALTPMYKASEFNPDAFIYPLRTARQCKHQSHGSDNPRDLRLKAPDQHPCPDPGFRFDYQPPKLPLR